MELSTVRIRELVYSDGRLMLREFYKDGKREGERKVWHDNGFLLVHEFYKNGELYGEGKRWYYNGQLQLHDVHGKEGECRGWHDNGQLQFIEFVRDGKRDGVRKEWLRNGQPRSLMMFHNNTRNGEYKIWHHADGTLIVHEFYRNNQLKCNLTIRKKMSILAFKGKCRRKCESVWKARFSFILGKDLARIIARYIV